MRKVAVVTGGAVNIGAAISKKLANSGFSIAIVYNSSKEKAEKISNEIENRGGQAACFQADVSNEKQVISLFKEIESNKTFGRIDTLVNNSGIFTVDWQTDLSASNWRKLFDINVTGSFLCCREAIKLMKKQALFDNQTSRGAIINTASINALHPGFGQTAHYDASKGAIFSYTKSLAEEVGKFGIRVNSISPGLVDSKSLRKHALDLSTMVEKRNPLKTATGNDKLVQADEVANVVLFLASEQASAITGENIIIDCGYLLS